MLGPHGVINPAPVKIMPLMAPSAEMQISRLISRRPQGPRANLQHVGCHGRGLPRARQSQGMDECQVHRT